MSSTANPISPSQFQIAIQDLPVENLYTKAREIVNSIAHLRQSNKTLQDYSDSIKNDASLDGEVKTEVGDRECLDAIAENEVVIRRQEERVGLLRGEVERRGGTWHDGDGPGEQGTNGNDVRGNSSGSRNGGGRLTDDELRRQMEERMGDENGEDGMHL